MWGGFLDAMGASRYIAHAMCLTFDPILMFLFTLSDGSTAISYFAIGIVLFLVSRALLRSSPEEVYEIVRVFMSDRGRLNTYLVLFGLFVVACGASHATMVATLYVGVYRLDILVRAAMGGVSMATAILVVSDYVTGVTRRSDGRSH